MDHAHVKSSMLFCCWQHLSSFTACYDTAQSCGFFVLRGGQYNLSFKQGMTHREKQPQTGMQDG